jgi:diguanylate cyclase (GGDEF)-like protein/PAS domain S-box-containing protein
MLMSYKSSLNSDITKTNKELEGLKRLEEMNKVIRSYNEVNRLKQIQKLTSGESYFQKRYQTAEKVVVAEMRSSSIHYNVILSRVADISDRYQLFFESDKNAYYLISLMIYNIPELFRYVDMVGEMEIQSISEGNTSQRSRFYLEVLRENIYNSIDNIFTTLERVHSKHSRELLVTKTELYNSINAVDIRIEKLITNKLDNTLSVENSLERYLKVQSSLGSFLTHLNIIAEEILRDRVFELNSKTHTVTLIVLITLLLSIAVPILILRVIRVRKKEEKKQKQASKYIKQVKTTFSEAKTLHHLVTDGLLLISKKFRAVNSILYIYDEKSQNFYLGNSYGVLEDNISNRIKLNEGIIGSTTKEIDIKEVNHSFSIGIANISINYIVTVPLITADKLVGVIQLSVATDRDVDMEYNSRLFSTVIAILSSYIYKVKKEEETVSYLNLIDSNVITSSTDENGKITEVSRAFERISGYKKEELIKKSHSIIRHEDMPESIFSDMWKTIKSGEIWSGELKNRCKNGGFYWVRTVIHPQFDFSKNIIGYKAIREDITDKKRIEELSIRDGLTGLYNRRHFDSVFEKLLKEFQENGKKLSFLLMDIDNFKKYNDTYGHQAGDTALRKVSKTVLSKFSKIDGYSFRLGGEEFGVLFDGGEKSLELSEELRIAIKELSIPHSSNDEKEVVTISMGLYIIEPESSVTEEEVYRCADKALYNSKKSGRDRVTLFKRTTK